MSAAPLPALAPGLLPHLPRAVRQPDYDRTALRAGMAHVGVGAFHRAHQAEYTDDLLERSFDRWGTVGINIRPPQVEPTLGRQSGLYTRLVRENERAEARVIGSILSVVDAQEDPAPALAVLASADIDVVTLTVTEKGYCHKPATGVLDEGAPGIAHDLRELSTPQTLPGLLARAMELRRTSHGRPLTVLSCDNIPANGVVLGNVVRALAERRGRRLADWIAANAAFPSSMVDRIAPAVTPADAAFVEGSFGYRDGAVAVGEPFRQWVIEKRFAGRVPRWDLAGATFVDDVEPFEHLKMRVLNGAQTALCYLGVLVGHEHTSDDMRDPLLSRFVRRMLLEETLSRYPLCRGSKRGPIASRASPACATRRSATATTRSRPTARRRSSSACSTPSANGSGAAMASRCLRPPSPPGWPISCAPPRGSGGSGRRTIPMPAASPPSLSGSATMPRRWFRLSWTSTRYSAANWRGASHSGTPLPKGWRASWGRTPSPTSDASARFRRTPA